MSSSLAVVILAAGQGTRMHSEQPKVLHELCGRSLLHWVLGNVAPIQPERVVTIVGHQRDKVTAALAAWDWSRVLPPGTAPPEVQAIVQEPQLGTAHAVLQAKAALEDFPGRILVLYGDTPLLTTATLRALIEARPEKGSSILTCELPDPTGMGRILRGSKGRVLGVVEERDATEDQRRLRETNSGVYVFEPGILFELLAEIGCRNQQGEYYLTDIVGLHVERALPLAAVPCLGGPEEVSGVNSLSDLARARARLQERILEDLFAAGVRIIDPDSAWIDADVEIGRGTVIHPSVVIHKGVRIGSNCSIGPFARIRPGTSIADGVEVGNFVEVNRTTMHSGSRAKHLTYLGDCEVGSGANIGAGTVTANYDGKSKHRTQIDSGAFIGSGAILVAPAHVGRDAKVGANAALIHTDVPAGAVYVGVPARPIGERRGDPGRAAPPSEESRDG